MTKQNISNAKRIAGSSRDAEWPKRLLMSRLSGDEHPKACYDLPEFAFQPWARRWYVPEELYSIAEKRLADLLLAVCAIIETKGIYDPDPLTMAQNTIQETQRIAKEALSSGGVING